MFHSSAIINQEAKIGNNTKIGPYCIVGENVKIGNDCVLHSHVVIEGDVEIGDNTQIFSFASIGSIPQDLKFKGEKTKVKIGNSCKIREYCTINLGTSGGGGITRVGDNCLLMVGTHIAHDCIVDNNVRLPRAYVYLRSGHKKLFAPSLLSTSPSTCVHKLIVSYRACMLPFAELIVARPFELLGIQQTTAT